MTQTLDALIEQLDGLLADLDAAESEHSDAIAAVADRHHRGAVNLVHYTALRQQSLRELQNDLMDLGATSLSTTEAHVRAKVHAARNVLAALRGDPGPWRLDAINTALDDGDDLLEANAQALFGPMRPARPTRIMVTLPSEAGQAGESGALVAAFVRAGMDVARVNCAHDDPAAWVAMIDNVHRAADLAGRPVTVSMDLPGPKLRTGPIADGPAVGRARVTRTPDGSTLAPARIWLTSADPPPPAPSKGPAATRAPLPLTVDPGWLAARREGDTIHLVDRRGRHRRFAVTATPPGGVLAEGPRSAYLDNDTKLTCRGNATTVSGIPPLTRTLSLAPGDLLTLTADLTPVEPPQPGQGARIGCTLPEALPAAGPGDTVLFDDGAITTVVQTSSAAELTVQVTRTKPGGQHLGAQKGINLPDTVLKVNALTDDDDTHLPFIAAHADLVAVSFVRTAHDVDHVLTRLHAASADHLGLLLKIETRQGFDNLPSILLAAMRHPRVGVMIARGDLAVEVGYERLAEVPRQILALCEAAHIPAIWATQVLETLAKTGQPSRAEITDAAAAQRADCVMLNKGPHIVDAITALDDILARMDRTQRKSRTLMRRIHSWDGQ